MIKLSGKKIFKNDPLDKKAIFDGELAEVIRENNKLKPPQKIGHFGSKSSITSVSRSNVSGEIRPGSAFQAEIKVNLPE